MTLDFQFLHKLNYDNLYYQKRKKWSQKRLAEMLDISIKHLSAIETGKVFASAELIERIIEEEAQNAIVAIKNRIHNR